MFPKPIIPFLAALLGWQFLLGQSTKELSWESYFELSSEFIPDSLLVVEDSAVVRKELFLAVFDQLLTDLASHKSDLKSGDFLADPYQFRPQMRHWQADLRRVKTRRSRGKIYGKGRFSELVDDIVSERYRPEVHPIGLEMWKELHIRFYSIDPPQAKQRLFYDEFDGKCLMTHAAVKDLRFVVGVPAFHLVGKHSGIVYSLPCLYLGREFQSYRASFQILSEIIRRRHPEMSESELRQKQVQIDGTLEYRPDSFRVLSHSPDTTVFQFTSDWFHTDYWAVVTHEGVTYGLVEESENIGRHVARILEGCYPDPVQCIYGDFSFRFLEKSRSKFLYEITPVEGEPFKAVYEKGEIRIRGKYDDDAKEVKTNLLWWL